MHTSFRNLTKHPLDIITSSGERITIPPSGYVARSNSARRSHGEINGIPICNIVYGKIRMPEEQPNIGLIVSAIVANEMRRNGVTRGDLYSPDQLVRDEMTGTVIGCRGLIKW